MPAIPTGDYLGMVNERRYAIICADEKLKGPLWVELPGSSQGWRSARDAFMQMVGQPYFARDVLLPALLARAQSAWEIVDLYELLWLGANIVGDLSKELPPGDEEPFHVNFNGSTGAANEERLGVSEWTALSAFTIHYHAEAISNDVLPKLQLDQAVWLAESLVIAETFVQKLSAVPRPGKELTDLEKQACEWTARLWQEWPKDKEFGILLGNEKPGYAEQRLRITLAPAPASAPTEGRRE